jgi:hypothetical protein
MKLTSIYFAECIAPDGKPFGAVKIGCSHNVKVRLQKLSAGQPYSCNVLASCPGGFLEEAFLHEWLRADQISGEFFRDTAEVRSLASSTRETNRFPLPVVVGSVPIRWIDQSGVGNFLAAHDLTVEQAVELTGRDPMFFAAGLRQKVPQRRLVASLAVAAVRKGDTVDWSADFLAHERQLREAA